LGKKKYSTHGLNVISLDARQELEEGADPENTRTENHIGGDEIGIQKSIILRSLVVEQIGNIVNAESLAASPECEDTLEHIGCSLAVLERHDICMPIKNRIVKAAVQQWHASKKDQIQVYADCVNFLNSTVTNDFAGAIEYAKMRQRRPNLLAKRSQCEKIFA